MFFFISSIASSLLVLPSKYLNNSDTKWRHLNKYVYLDSYFDPGAMFYGLNKKSCSQLIENSFPIKKAVDGFIGDITNIHSKKKGLNLYSVSPKYAFSSDLSHNNNSNFKSSFKPWKMK